VTSNRLINEKSPYLLQHAYNPVDWYPWGLEAFEKARKENKPILLSVGYSTCHWCHVMERESFEDDETAALMNQYLVSIKVDREERPDVDKVYMTAVSAMTGQGGWPLNIFLTPDLKPIYGGTYFPPAARWKQPAWKEVVSQIGRSWQDAGNRETMLVAAANITDALKKYTEQTTAIIEGNPAWLDNGFSALKAAYDAVGGGFSAAPKFPMSVYHNFLLRYNSRTKNKEALEMSLHTLRTMARGGIYDHLGGGFARYSTDADWHVPHFEKMLYDNAQLAVNYLEAYQITREDDFKRIAQETLAYIQRDMTHPEGGFYSAEDADSLLSLDAKEEKEGAFYAWGKKEILEILGEVLGEQFCALYDVRSEGNALNDLHGEFSGKNILHLKDSPATPDLMRPAREKLFAARQKRPRPHLDDKIISAWNGLMISAFAKAFQVLGDEGYLRSARRAAEFIKKNLYDPQTRRLSRRWREGNKQEFGIANDYAFLAQGLIDLYETDFNPEWLNWAGELTEALNKRFHDAEKGGFFMNASDQDEHLILRVKEDMDNVEPSASSVAALNLLRLAQLTDRYDYKEVAENTLKCFGMNMKEAPRALPQMLVALDFALTEPRQIVMAGKPGSDDTRAMLQTLHRRFIPVKTIKFSDGIEMKPIDGKASAYVCIRHACQQPTNDPGVLESLL